MTNTLRALRADLQTVLTTAGMVVLDHLPERITPPVAIIAAGSPYLEGGETYGSFNVRFTLVLVCAAGTNDTTTRALDSTVTAAVVGLDTGDWRLERVDQPTMLAHGGTHYLSTTLDVLRPVTGIADDGSA